MFIAYRNANNSKQFLHNKYASSLYNSFLNFMKIFPF